MLGKITGRERWGKETGNRASSRPGIEVWKRWRHLGDAM